MTTTETQSLTDSLTIRRIEHGFTIDRNEDSGYQFTGPILGLTNGEARELRDFLDEHLE